MIYKFNRKKVSLYLAIALALMIIVSVASFSFNGNKAVFAYNEVGGQEEAIESLQNESVQRGLEDTVGSIADGKGLGKGIF